MSKMGSVKITLDDFNQRLDWAVGEIMAQNKIDSDINRRINDTNKAVDAISVRLDIEMHDRFAAVLDHSIKHEVRLNRLERLKEKSKPVTGNGQAMNNPPYSDWAYDPDTGRIIDTTAPVAIDIDPPRTSEHSYYPKAKVKPFGDLE